MTALERFDQRMAAVAYRERETARQRRIAKELEAQALDEFGIEYVAREAGFPCWRVKGEQGFYHTPRQALEAKDALSR